MILLVTMMCNDLYSYGDFGDFMGLTWIDMEMHWGNLMGVVVFGRDLVAFS